MKSKDKLKLGLDISKINHIISRKMDASVIKAIDDNWIEQVDYLQQLQQAIGSQTASQKNPIVEYYQEAFAGFETMKKQIKKDMVRNLLLSQVLVSEDGNIVTYFP